MVNLLCTTDLTILNTVDRPTFLKPNIMYVVQVDKEVRYLGSDLYVRPHSHYIRNVGLESKHPINYESIRNADWERYLSFLNYLSYTTMTP